MDQTVIPESNQGQRERAFMATPVNGVKLFPPVVALVCLAGGLALHLLGHGPRMVGAHHVIGLLLIAFAAGLASYAAGVFDGSDTTKDPYGEPTKFVTRAPYTFTRNPMYLSLTIALLGFAVFFRSPVMILSPIAFFLIIDRMLIPQEEAKMERLFGAQYLDYKARVRRWL